MTDNNDFPCCGANGSVTGTLVSETMLIPTSLNLTLIGKPVSIQTFLYTWNEKDEKDGNIDLDSMKKWVGILQFFSIEDDIITISMVGSQYPLFIDKSARHFEIYTVQE